MLTYITSYLLFLAGSCSVAVFAGITVMVMRDEELAREGFWTRAGLAVVMAFMVALAVVGLIELYPAVA